MNFNNIFIYFDLVKITIISFYNSKPSLCDGLETRMKGFMR